MRKAIFLIGNPVAGRGSERKFNRAAQILSEKGFDVKLLLTTSKGDAERFARQISSEFGDKGSGAHSSKPLVIAAGGDGTYNEVANGLAHSNIPMAILPMGTTSVLAKELNIHENIEDALDIAVSGSPERIHIGKITLLSSSIERYFLLMAGVGFDAEAVINVNEGMKRIFGRTAYILNGLDVLLRHNPKPITIAATDISVRLDCYAAIIGKASCYGGRFKITPDARLTDPNFYTFTINKKGRIALLNHIWGILRGRHLEARGVSYFRTTGLDIEGDAHIQIDGDYLGRAPARIEIEPDAIIIVRPNK
ncbi:MAG: diacylglycerol kinase family lipid kinase [Nitrospirae bacterium]|nr:diacylglycerol kinase family lipid kinase [Nitrospirota bacterium]